MISDDDSIASKLASTVGTGPAMSGAKHHQAIRRAFTQIAGDPPMDSVRLSKLRANLNTIPRQQLDQALTEMKRGRQLQLVSLDNPRDIKAEEPHSLIEGGNRYHAIWIPP